jgi:type II secretory pathway pseudopilin PulG
VLRRAREEGGFALPELLVAMGLLIVALTATLSTFDGFRRATGQNMAQNTAQTAARTTVDRLARELRSTGSPGQTDIAIERAQPTEFIFDTVDPSGRGGANSTGAVRVRYCLDSADDQLWRQVQTWTTDTRPGVPSPNACPHSSYGSQAMVTNYVVNDHSGASRPVFTYDSSNLADIGSVTVDLYTDTDVNAAPNAQRLSTTVFLRNDNRAPTAGFTATVTGSQHVLLNGSQSEDPDGDSLTYTWYDGSTVIGSGPLLDYASPTAGTHTYSLTVTDTGGLVGSAPPQTIEVT